MSFNFGDLAGRAGAWLNGRLENARQILDQFKIEGAPGFTFAQRFNSQRESNQAFHNLIPQIKTDHVPGMPQDDRAKKPAQVSVPIVLTQQYADVKEEARELLRGVGFKDDTDIAAYNQKYETNLVKDTAEMLAKRPVVYNNGQRVYDKTRKKDVWVARDTMLKSDYDHFQQFLGDRGKVTSLSGNGQTNAGNISERQATTGIKLDPVTVTVAAGTLGAAGTVLIEAMPTQIVKEISLRPIIETGAKAAVALGELAPPVAMIAAGAAAPALIGKHVGDLYNQTKDEIERGQATRNYDLARDLAKATTITITMDDAEPQMQPLPIPEGKTKERPYATPQAQPKVQDLPTAPTDLVPTGKAQPQAKPETEAKPETKTDDLPQPYTPDAPRNNQPQQPPQTPRQPNSPKNLDRVIPPIIVGTAAGKAINDAVNSQSTVGRTQPSLVPDPNRIPEGKAKVSNKNDNDPSNLRAIERENESAKVLVERGYKVTQLSDSVKGNIQRVKKPDFEIEGQIFDNYAPSANKSARGVWAEIKDKITDPKTGVKQADRFVININDSKLSIEELNKQFKDFPLEGLQEIILVKDGEVIHFFPFEN